MKLFLKFVLTCCLVLLVGLCVFFLSRVNMSMPHWVSEDHPVDYYKRLSDQEFDTKKQLVVTVDLKGQKRFYDFEFLKSLDHIIHQLKAEDFIFDVNCFHTQQVITSQGEQGLLVSCAQDMLEEGYLKNESDYRDFILKQEDFVPRLITESQRYIVLTIQLNCSSVTQLSIDEKKSLFEFVQGVLNRSLWCQNYFFSGGIWSEYTLEVMVFEKSRLFLPVSILLMFLLLMFLLRSYRRAVVIFLVVMMSLMTLFMLQIILKMAFTNFSFIAICIILTLNVSDTIHFFNHFDMAYSRLKDRDLSLKKALKGIFMPCLLTSLTTALTVFSSFFSSIIPLREFALTASLSVCFSFFYMLTLSFIALRDGWVEPLSLNTESSDRRQSSFFSYRKLAQWVFRFSRPLVIISTFFTVIGFGFFFRYGTFESRLIDSFFFKSSSVYQNVQFMNDYCGGGDVLSVIIRNHSDTLTAGLFRDIENFRKVSEASMKVLGHSSVNFVDGYHKLISHTHVHLCDDQSQEPQTNEALGQEIAFLEFSKSDQQKDVLAPYFNFDGSVVRLALQCDYLPMVGAQKIYDYVRNQLALIFSDQDIGYTGSVFSDVMLDQELKNSFFNGVLFSFLFIGLIFIGCFGFFWGLVGLLPNILPLSFLYFLLPLLGQPADFSLFLVSIISFGFCVDHTIHLLFFFRYNHLDSFVDLYEKALFFLWKPIVYTTIVFLGGFLLFIFSFMFLLVKFSLLFSLVLLLGFFSDMFYLPSLITFISKYLGYDVYRKKYSLF